MLRGEAREGGGPPVRPSARVLVIAGVTTHLSTRGYETLEMV